MKRPVTVNIDTIVLKRLDEVCEDEDMTRSDVMRKLVDYGLRNWKRARR